ncbi:MAG TPA: DUF1553 domain-containing protein [Verrucomicrobiae bacterium]|nr:DUF1553 domain-containing protein [Verrucomicrobiae bacterium]
MRCRESQVLFPGRRAHQAQFSLFAFCALLFFGSLVEQAGAGPAAVRSDSGALRPEFDRDIRPILAENCYPCHGPDENKRKAKLRLDLRDAATKPLPDGEIALVPGKPQESKLVERITAKDPDDLMPPVKSGKKLTPQDIDLIRRWISDGAKWQNHWSFVAPHRPTLPAVKNKRWLRNEIDSFVLARLEQEGLTPTPEAETSVLLRRLSLDLTGLPPTPDQLRSWSRRRDPVSTAIDELLASPHFGERMASDWMDLARYADTHGFNNDVLRSMWRWRDWVIEAFNRNLPYDRFITEQLAGDLLPKPTLDQLIATGFNRNHGINSEGGIIDEEYRVEYVADRVRTTSIAWLGLTMECARCHDHKFDPISQKDFFRFFAFFNNVDETGEDGRFANAAPILPAPTRQQQLEMARHRAELATAQMKMQSLAARTWKDVVLDEIANRLPYREPAATTNDVLRLEFPTSPNPESVTNLAGGKPFQIRGDWLLTNGPLAKPALVLNGKSNLRTDSLPAADYSKGWAFSTWVRRDGSNEAVLFSTANFKVPPSAEQFGEGLQVRLNNRGALDVRLAHRWPGYAIQLLTRESIPTGEWHQLLLTCDGSMAAKGLRVWVDGEEWFRDVIHDDLTLKLGPTGAAVIGGSDEKGLSGFVGALARPEIIAAPAALEELAAHARAAALRFAADTPPQQRTAWQAKQLQYAWLEQHQPEFAPAAEAAHSARSALLAIESDSPSTMVMRELPQERPTFVLFRGQYDSPRDRVEPDVPEFILPFSKKAPRNRLGLAEWLTDPANPLTARVVVNRFWQALFGTGLVKTSENFGYQGEAPSHPELLDWLAVDFREHGWDVKRLLRQLANSATYRQDSRSTEALNERDPENRLLAHGPRQRLTGEMVRDQALFLSGLLHDEIGGPPVYPYQPTNLYKGIVVAADYPGTSYTESSGPELYRRSLYTFWKRTVPHPSLSTFDVPDREVCTARRPKTNTPLQALAAMNDTYQVESARKLAERMLLQGGASPADRLTFAFQLATARKPKAEERGALCSLLERRLTVYRNDPAAARAFLSVGASQADAHLDAIELAAYANVASLILNLDETISRN